MVIKFSADSSITKFTIKLLGNFLYCWNKISYAKSSEILYNPFFMKVNLNIQVYWNSKQHYIYAHT